jgi:deoxycytidylate deaminase
VHHTANNFRRSGQPFKTEETDPENIYKIARIINRIIKATKQESEGECHIVIDSLRNSLEINFFKERYSAFYLITVKSDRRRTRLIEMYKVDECKIDRLLEIDEDEYGSSDFQKGIFYAPDVQNCIQMADYHINNRLLKEDFITESKDNTFCSLDEQLMKLQGLIQQPGLITPEPTERVMQIAYTAKLNSGCISRQVGAVVTDDEFSTKAIGWNDVPKGALPCSLRNVKEIANPKMEFGFTQFELGKGLKETEQINHGELDKERDKERDKESKEFNKYNDTSLPDAQLGGRNCPYCFKSTYNAFSGEKNQVHTRSLHAEENAMMQISKYGGQGLKNGYLFTTASPCELCAKKAYQLGIRTIYFIDPYPGISRNHILKSMEGKDPKMVLFSGAVGKAYHKLYEPFLSQKDELALLTNFKLESPQKVKAKSLRNLLGDSLKGKGELKKKLDKLLESDENVFDEFIKVIEKGLNDKTHNDGN